MPAALQGLTEAKEAAWNGGGGAWERGKAGLYCRGKSRKSRCAVGGTSKMRGNLEIFSGTEIPDKSKPSNGFTTNISDIYSFSSNN